MSKRDSANSEFEIETGPVSGSLINPCRECHSMLKILTKDGAKPKNLWDTYYYCQCPARKNAGKDMVLPSYNESPSKRERNSLAAESNKVNFKPAFEEEVNARAKTEKSEKD